MPSPILVTSASVAIVVAFLGAVAVGGLLGGVGATPVAGCPADGVNNATAGTHYYWAVYQSSTGAIDELLEFNQGSFAMSPGQSAINTTSNMSLTNAMWCDQVAGHLSYWHVDLSTSQLVRTPS